MKALTLCLLVLLPAVARARPASAVVDLPPGKEEFFRAFLHTVVSDDPAVVSAELLPSQEVLLTAVGPGRTLVYLLGETRLDAVRLRVRGEGGKTPEVHATEAQRAAALAACPGFKEEGPATERTVSAVVSSAGCRAALRELFAGDEYSVRRIELQFSPEALLDQLAAIRAALKERGLGAVEVGYSGLTLTLRGKVTAAQRLELAKAVYDAAVGPVLIDDQLEVEAPPEKPRGEEAPDAGAAAPDAGPTPAGAAPKPRGKATLPR